MRLIEWERTNGIEILVWYHRLSISCQSPKVGLLSDKGTENKKKKEKEEDQ